MAARRIPLTIWRHATLDLWRLMAVSAAVLIAVVAFAVTIRPLSEGKLDPVDALKFMALAIIPMSVYALPFAGGFAATLVHHRMSQENELTAAHAGGISHKRLLVPALVSGLTLAIVHGGLSDQVVPRFLRQMEQLISFDIPRLMLSRLNRGETIAFEGTQIFAERAEAFSTTDLGERAGEADSVLLLAKPAFMRLENQGTIQSVMTAARAWVFVYYGGGGGVPGATSVVIKPEKLSVSSGSGAIAQAGDAELSYVIPGALADDPKFHTLGELSALRDTPEAFNFIDNRRRHLVFKIANVRALDAMNDSLRESGEITLSTPEGGWVRVEAERLSPRGWQRHIAPPQGRQILVTRSIPGGPVESFSAENAQIRGLIGTNETNRELRYTLDMQSVMTLDAQGESTGRRAVLLIDDLRTDETELGRLDEMGCKELMGEVRPLIERPDPIRYLVPEYEDLKKKVRELEREITSKQHERVATSASCLVMVLLGSVIAMRLRDAMPLQVYLWSFFPALGTIVTISMGQQVTHELGIIGVPLIWAGVIGLAVYAGVVLRSVQRR